MTKTIRVNQQDIIYQEQEHNNLLECLEAADVDIEYHCRDGYCGACRVKLEQGQVCYPQGEPLAFIGEKEILPCCCIPTTNIKLTID